MSAHADKTLHREIYNISDTDTFPQEEGIFHEFRARIQVRNLYKFARIRTNSYEFFARKIGYVTNGLYCMFQKSVNQILRLLLLLDHVSDFSHLDSISKL